MAGSLTQKQARFVEEYTVDFNATAAAVRSGYSPKTAYNAGWQNVRKCDIAEAIAKRVDEMTMRADEALLKLTQWGRGTLEPFIRTNEDGEFWLTLGDEKAQSSLHLLKKIKQTKTITRGKDDYEREEVRTEIEIHDAKDAVIQMAKIRGQYVERQDITSDGAPITQFNVYIHKPKDSDAGER